MTRPSFYLTRHAAQTLRAIYAHSEKQWGRAKAERYVVELYAVMHKAAANPDLGKLRAAPFRMLPAGKHFIIYDRFKKGVVVLALLHQRRDIETLVAEMEPRFFAESEAIKKKL